MDKLHVYKDQAGEWRWSRRAPNGETVADGSEGYEHQADAIAAAEREGGDDAEVVVDE